MGTGPATDKGYIDWLEQQPKSVSKHGTSYCTNLYVQNLNFEGKVLYERQLKEYKDKLLSTNVADSVLVAEPIEAIAPDGTDTNALP